MQMSHTPLQFIYSGKDNSLNAQRTQTAACNLWVNLFHQAAFWHATMHYCNWKTQQR